MSLHPTALTHTTLAFTYRIWNSRLAYLASLLILLLQRTPILRTLADGRLTLNTPRFASVFKISTATATVYGGATHAVTGATAPEISPVSPSTNPAEILVGEPMVWVFSASIPGKKARSYRVEGLPPGVEYSGEVASNSFASLQGTPTSPGEFTVEITAFHFANFGGEASPVYELALNVIGEAAAAPVITKELVDQLASLGDSVTLTVEADGPALAYTWVKDGVPLEGQSEATLTLENVTAEDAGLYTVTVTNNDGSVSSAAELKVAATEIPIPDGHTLYTISARDAFVRAIGADGATLSSVAMTMEGHTVKGGAGLATDPISGTLYAILKLQAPPNDGVGDRVLATLDPVTGAASLVGTPAADALIKFSGLAFDPQGQLYAVTGNDPSAVSPETLYTIDKSTGEAQEFLALGNGDEGEAITFDPDSGLLIHASGGPAPQVQVFETVDLANQTITPIEVQGSWKEGKALTAIGNGRYLIADEEAFYILSQSGDVALIGTIDHITKGFAFVSDGAGELVRITRLEYTADDTILLGFPANPGESFRIDSSDDLVTWRERAQITIPDGESEALYTDTEITAELQARFYRAMRN